MYVYTEKAHLPGFGEISNLTGHDASEDDDPPGTWQEGLS